MAMTSRVQAFSPSLRVAEVSPLSLGSTLVNLKTILVWKDDKNGLIYRDDHINDLGGGAEDIEKKKLEALLQKNI